jgi:cysteine-rich repeat protein
MNAKRFDLALAFLGGCAFCMNAAAAHAAIVESADDVCAPSANPCVISTALETDADFPLDFGLRTVRIVEGGTITGTLDLSCGRFEVQSASTWFTPPDEGEITITANRSCSLAPSIACLSDATCSGVSAGICSGGDGSIALSGELAGNSPTVMLRAAGDIDLEGRIDVTSEPPAEYGGTVFIESIFGSVESAAFIDASGGMTDSYDTPEPAYGGSVTMRAAVDVTLRGPISATGGSANVEIDAGRDAVVLASMMTQGRKGAANIGGTIDLNAGRDLNVVQEAGLVRPVLDISGGDEMVQGYYGYGGGSAAYPGGYAFFKATGDVVVGNGVRLLGDSGMSTGFQDDLAISGDWYFEAGDDIEFNATMSDRAWGLYGSAYHGVSFDAGDAVHIGRKGTITTAGAYAGAISIYAGGPVNVEGRLNARARKVKTPGYGYGGGGSPPHGTGGDVTIGAGDVTLKGKVMTGGPSAAGSLYVNACRLHMRSGGKLDAGWGAQLEGVGDTWITIAESMVADGGSWIRGKEGSTNEIRYRDATKPPILHAAIFPAPSLVVDSNMSGCPVCGNAEIDQGETCDDGNTVAGDGCDAQCLIAP